MKNLYLILFTFVLIACGNKQETNKSSEQTSVNNNQIIISTQQFDSEKMELGSITKQDFNNIVNVNGMIDVPPENKFSVTTFIGGYVTKIPLLVGDKVKKGQIVASLKNTEFIEIQQHYLETTAKLSYLKNEYGRQKKLFEEKITSQKNYLKAESDYKTSLATYNGLHKKLQLLNINPTAVKKGNISSTINLYAPINGYVTEVNASNGSFISAASKLLEIVNTDHIHLELNVFEKDILKIKKTQKIEFEIPESSNKKFYGEVHLVGTSINKNRTIKVHGHINDEENHNFISGMFVEGKIICNSKKEFALPKTSIVKTENQLAILVLNSKTKNNYVFEKVYIKSNAENESFIQISDVTSVKNKQILTKGIYMLLTEE